MAAVGCSSCPVGFQASRPCSHHSCAETLAIPRPRLPDTRQMPCLKGLVIEEAVLYDASVYGTLCCGTAKVAASLATVTIAATLAATEASHVTWGDLLRSGVFHDRKS